jgi:hypothetical protein
MTIGRAAALDGGVSRRHLPFSLFFPQLAGSTTFPSFGVSIPSTGPPFLSALPTPWARGMSLINLSSLWRRSTTNFPARQLHNRAARWPGEQQDHGHHAASAAAQEVEEAGHGVAIVIGKEQRIAGFLFRVRRR